VDSASAKAGLLSVGSESQVRGRCFLAQKFQNRRLRPSAAWPKDALRSTKLSRVWNATFDSVLFP
jgi:hypothetical protein